jgi:hypothetical protein
MAMFPSRHNGHEEKLKGFAAPSTEAVQKHDLQSAKNNPGGTTLPASPSSILCNNSQAEKSSRNIMPKTAQGRDFTCHAITAAIIDATMFAATTTVAAVSAVSTGRIRPPECGIVMIVINTCS